MIRSEDVGSDELFATTGEAPVRSGSRRTELQRDGDVGQANVAEATIAPD
jgi:hypothetical protein